jgi:hypothetical protein
MDAWQANSNGTYAISETTFYRDKGWKYYVDNFEVLDIYEKVLATRVLFPPRVDELQFTRSIGNVPVPVGTTPVITGPHDSKHGIA